MIGWFLKMGDYVLISTRSSMTWMIRGYPNVGHLPYGGANGANRGSGAQVMWHGFLATTTFSPAVPRLLQP